jgi:hypothetical protein
MARTTTAYAVHSPSAPRGWGFKATMPPRQEPAIIVAQDILAPQGLGRAPARMDVRIHRHGALIQMQSTLTGARELTA